MWKTVLVRVDTLWRGDIWRLSSTDEIHPSHGQVIAQWVHQSSVLRWISSSQRARIMFRSDVVLFILFSSWPCERKRKLFTAAEPGPREPMPLINLYFIFLNLRGVPKRLLSRPAWDPERLEDDIPHCTGARGSYHLPVWPRLWPGGTRDPHLPVRPHLELPAPLLWKESVPRLPKCVCVWDLVQFINWNWMRANIWIYK